jgi:hypothetical protein
MQYKLNNSPLWISIDGEALTSRLIGNYVTNFFKRECNLNISSTLLRGLMESHAEELFCRGEISAAARKSVSTINGHSEDTARRFYVRNNIGFDVCRSRELFEQKQNISNDNTTSSSSNSGSSISCSGSGSGSSSSSSCRTSICGREENYSTNHCVIEDSESIVNNLASLFTPNEISRESMMDIQFDDISSNTMSPFPISFDTAASVGFPTVATYKPKPLPVWSDLDWGTDHPFYGKPHKRTPWTEREIEYVGNYIVKNAHVKNVAAQCLQKIRHDPEAVPIFHKNHILDSARLRSGIDNFKSRNVYG